MPFFRALRMLLSLKCSESTELISQGHDRDLTRVERYALRLHLLTCTACRKFRKQLDFIYMAAQRPQTDPPQLSPEQRARIEQQINKLGK